MGWFFKECITDYGLFVYIDIESIDNSLSSIIDNHIAKICYGDSSFSVGKAKKYIKNFISTENYDRKKGAIAEFFIHLYLNISNYKQECAFKNLEESSPKKGFDGVYLDSNNDIWYMESKSGDIGSCSHKGKVEEAYLDLKSKIEGKTKNDPWLNAYYHVKAVDSTKPLLEQFLKYSEDFDNNVRHDIGEFCIAPCGTVIVNNGEKFDHAIILDNISEYFSRKDYEKLIAICVTQRAICDFEEYLSDNE